jgi:hypothetical protein
VRGSHSFCSSYLQSETGVSSAIRAVYSHPDPDPHPTFAPAIVFSHTLQRLLHDEPCFLFRSIGGTLAFPVTFIHMATPCEEFPVIVCRISLPVVAIVESPEKRRSHYVCVAVLLSLQYVRDLVQIDVIRPTYPVLSGA